MSGTHCTKGVESVMRSKSRDFIYTYFILSLDKVLMECTCSQKLFIVIIRVFCPRAGLSQQNQAPRLQFYPKAGLLPQTQEARLQFY